jgi:mitochondrial fission protein ELM1
VHAELAVLAVRVRPDLARTVAGVDVMQLASAARARAHDHGEVTLCVASGRDAVAAAAALRHAAQGAAFVVQLQHPRCRFSLFDTVAMPAHDLPSWRPPTPNLDITLVRSIPSICTISMLCISMLTTRG